MYAKGRDIDLGEQREILEGALQSAREQGERGVLVFDLDSTVFDNRPRQARILREFGEVAGLAVLRAASAEHFTNWDLQQAMLNAGVDEKIASEHAPGFKDFWGSRFFTSAYCVEDVPTPGARDFLVAVAETGAQIAYVTGRYLEMGEGTRACFERHGFPMPSRPTKNASARVHLLLKPDLATSDDAWKKQACARLDEMGTVVAAFDNEPAHINGYAARYIGAHCVHLATDDSGRAIVPAPGVPSIADFRRLP